MGGPGLATKKKRAPLRVGFTSAVGIKWIEGKGKTTQGATNSDGNPTYTGQLLTPIEKGGFESHVIVIDEADAEDSVTMIKLLKENHRPAYFRIHNKRVMKNNISEPHFYTHKLP